MSSMVISQNDTSFCTRALMSVMDLLKAQQISDDESFQYLTTTD